MAHDPSNPFSASRQRAGLFRRYQVTLRARLGEPPDGRVIEVTARTLGAVRRIVQREHPGLVIARIDLVE